MYFQRTTEQTLVKKPFAKCLYKLIQKIIKIYGKEDRAKQQQQPVELWTAVKV